MKLKFESDMSENAFETKLTEINGWKILKIPQDVSVKLPSRGLNMISGSLNDIPFKTVLEPDGNYAHDKKSSHWFRPGEELIEKANVNVGDSVHLSIESTKDWIEPDVPSDLQSELNKSQKARDTWEKTTPNARWDWIRWIRSTNNPQTRVKRIRVEISKLEKGEKRPCCFNRNMCTVPEVCKSGVLLPS